jgi:cell fate regulator YaaT (PSP1 superfamily)
MDKKFKENNGCAGICCKGCGKMDAPLNTFDWLAGVPENEEYTDIVEVQFKNTHKGYYKNSNNIPLQKGDIVAVEAVPGHDIGVVTMTGRLVLLQLKKTRLTPESELKRIYRKARPVDMEKYAEAKAREHDTMIRSRQIAKDLNLDMKIGFVSTSLDRSKHLISYTADDRVDFRELAKKLAAIYKTRIELRQIGVRDKAKEVGGYGQCGRKLCCSSFLKDMNSVSINMAKKQNLALNPQKINGVCGRLMCCLEYENDCYDEYTKGLPKVGEKINTPNGYGKVIFVDLFARSYKVELDDMKIVEIKL